MQKSELLSHGMHLRVGGVCNADAPHYQTIGDTIASYTQISAQGELLCRLVGHGDGI